jgi:hypothetical protein
VYSGAPEGLVRRFGVHSINLITIRCLLYLILMFFFGDTQTWGHGRVNIFKWPINNEFTQTFGITFEYMPRHVALLIDINIFSGIYNVIVGLKMNGRSPDMTQIDMLLSVILVYRQWSKVYDLISTFLLRKYTTNN